MISPTLREWESVGIQLRPLGNAAYVACLPHLCQGSKWLNGKSVWLVFRKSWVRIPAVHGFISHSLSINHRRELNLSKPTYVYRVKWWWKKTLRSQVTITWSVIRDHMIFSKRSHELRVCWYETKEKKGEQHMIIKDLAIGCQVVTEHRQLKPEASEFKFLPLCSFLLFA